MNILVFEHNDIHSDALNLLRENGHHVVEETAADLDRKMMDAVFVRTYTQVDSAFLDQYPHLKHVIKAGVGLDNIQLAECQKRGISVHNSPGANAHSVAELAIGLTIFLMRNVHAQIESLNNHQWRQRQYLGSEVAGKTIGILGCGAVGKLVAKKISGFDVTEILGYDPYLSVEQLAAAGITKAELSEVIERSDAIILSIPLTPETHDLIKLEQLKQMKPTSYIINVSRGGIINEQDLCQALDSGIIAGAALDVFENEPLGIKPELLNCKNLIATPHIGGFTTEGDKAMCVVAAQNFLNSLKV